MTALVSFPDQLNAQQQALRGENSSWFNLIPAALQSTATRQSGKQSNLGCEGILVEVIIANEAGTCGFTPKLYTVDPDGTDVLLWAGTEITANGTYKYWIHPHADKTATVVNSMTSLGTISVPRDWYFELTYSTGTPASDKMDTVAHACYVR